MNPTKPITSEMFGDINYLYPTVMAALFPVGEYYELKPKEIENLFPDQLFIFSYQ